MMEGHYKQKYKQTSRSLCTRKLRRIQKKKDIIRFANFIKQTSFVSRILFG